MLVDYTPEVEEESTCFGGRGRDRPNNMGRILFRFSDFGGKVARIVTPFGSLASEGRKEESK